MKPFLLMLLLLAAGCDSPDTIGGSWPKAKEPKYTNRVSDAELDAESARVTAMRAEMRGDKTPKEFTP